MIFLKKTLLFSIVLLTSNASFANCNDWISDGKTPSAANATELNGCIQQNFCGSAQYTGNDRMACARSLSQASFLANRAEGQQNDKLHANAVAPNTHFNASPKVANNPMANANSMRSQDLLPPTTASTHQSNNSKEDNNPWF